MESVSTKALGRMAPFARLAVLLLAVAAGASCGQQKIEGRPPFIGIAGMSLDGRTLSADFRISNQNDVPMTITAIDITVRVDDAELVAEDRSLTLAIDANSAEELQVEELPEDFTLDLLASLQSGDVKSLPFALWGRVHTEESGYLRFEHKGHLYPVPGRPGAFRSAVTQAEDLRRED